MYFIDDVNCWFFFDPAQHINHTKNDKDDSVQHINNTKNDTDDSAQHINHTKNDADEREDERSNFIRIVPGVAISLLIVAVVIAAIMAIILAGVWLWRRYVNSHLFMCVQVCRCRHHYIKSR